MTTSYKPDGYTSASPYLVVPDPRATIRFLAATFDATALYEHPGDDGVPVHAEVRIDDTVVMIGRAMEGWPAGEAHVHVYVRDVDATYARALAAGGESVQAPVQKGDPDKRGGVKEPGGGTTWWIATRVG